MTTRKEAREIFTESGLSIDDSKNLEKKVFAMKKDDLDEYTELIYNLHGLILNKNSSIELLSDLEQNKIGFSSKIFDELREILQEQDNYTENPNDVSADYKSIVVCRFCSSNHTISRLKQKRSSDEGMTNEIECLSCKKKYTRGG